MMGRLDEIEGHLNAGAKWILADNACWLIAEVKRLREREEELLQQVSHESPCDMP
jgi:hypothetical protein